MKELDLVIPVYNSERTIALLVRKLNEWALNAPFKLHVIFVDDGSRDNTFIKLNEELKHVSFSFQTIKLAQNYGQHTATATGFFMSRSQLVATIDDDLQHDPSDLEQLYTCLVNGNHDLVYGSFAEKKHHATRNFGTRLLQSVLKFEGRDYSMVTSYRIMKSPVISIFKNKQTKTHFIDDFLLLSASSVSSCTISHASRSQGRSGYTFGSLVKMASVILVLHSSLPLKIISRMGLIMSLAFFVMGCFYIYDKLVNAVSIGFTSLIVAIFFSTGLILFSLGIIGEYIRRIWVSKQDLDKVIIAEICKR